MSKSELSSSGTGARVPPPGGAPGGSPPEPSSIGSLSRQDPVQAIGLEVVAFLHHPQAYHHADLHNLDSPHHHR